MRKKHNILIADNDYEFVKSTKYVLQESDFRIYHSDRKDKILEYIRTQKIDLLVLGSETEEMVSAGKEIESTTDMPLIIVTEVENEISKIFALENGADDYLIKPINPYELRARICNILRRYHQGKLDNLRGIERNNFIIDVMKKRIYTKDGVDMDLTGKEFELFYLLSSKPGRVFTRDELMSKIWEYENFGTSRTVDVHIRKLRSKIEDKLGTKHIKTKWGEGYYFKSCEKYKKTN